MNSTESTISQSSLPGPNPRLKAFLQNWVFLSISVLLVVWALPHTIAARNIAIFSGLLASIAWLLIAKPTIQWKTFWPSICLLMVPVWVLFHYFFISELKEQQWQELSSTWLRTSAVVILGSIAGIMIAIKPSRILWLVVSICVLPTLTFVLYVNQVYLQHGWILPSGMFYVPFKGKFSAAYFVLCQVLVGFAILSCPFQKNQRMNLWQIILGLVLILIGIADFIAARALNGVLITFLGLLFHSFFFCIKNIFSKNHSAMNRLKLIAYYALSLCILITALYSFLVYDQRYEGKLTNLISDIKIASQIETNQAWVKDGRPFPHPVDSNGRPLNGSTYERVSWFIKGFVLIKENPLGNGLSHQAFGYYIREQFPNSSVLMTHSAWVDFTLGLGLPGLLLTWAAIRSVVFRCISALKFRINLKSSQFNANEGAVPGKFLTIASLWFISGIFCFWVIGEVSEREYIEHYFFLIAAFGVAATPRTDQSLN